MATREQVNQQLNNVVAEVEKQVAKQNSGHKLSGDNAYWDQVIHSIEEEQRVEAAEQARDNHPMFNVNEHWNKVIESIAFSATEANEVRGEPSPNQEESILQKILLDAVKRVELILNANNLERTQVLQELTKEELAKYEGKELSASEITQISNDFHSKINQLIENYSLEKENKVSWSHRIEQFKAGINSAVQSVKESTLSKVQAIKEFPGKTKERVKNAVRLKLLQVVVSTNQKLQMNLAKAVDKLSSNVQQSKRTTVEQDPTKKVAEPVKEKVEPQQGEVEQPTSVKQTKTTEKMTTNSVIQAIDVYKEEYKKHIIQTFNKNEPAANYNQLRKLDELLKNSPELIINIRAEALQEVRKDYLENRHLSKTEELNFEQYSKDKADLLHHSLTFMEKTQQQAFITADLENTPYVSKTQKEIRSELMADLKKEEMSEAALENFTNPGSDRRDNEDLKTTTQNKMDLLEKIEAIDGGEKILTDREQKYSLYAAYHNFVAKNPESPIEERRELLGKTSEELKAADERNNTNHYKDIYFEHELNEQGKIPSDYTFEQVYKEFGIGKDTVNEQVAETEMELE